MLTSIDLMFGEPKARKRANSGQAVRGAVELSRMFPPCESEINFKLVSIYESVLTATERQAGDNSLKQTGSSCTGLTRPPFEIRIGCVFLIGVVA